MSLVIFVVLRGFRVFDRVSRGFLWFLIAFLIEFLEGFGDGRVLCCGFAKMWKCFLIRLTLQR